jgi:GxxExxY protein
MCLDQELGAARTRPRLPELRGTGRLPIIYKGMTIALDFRTGGVFENSIILEIKAVAALLAANETQLLLYLCMSHLRIGLLMNFHARRLKEDPRRFIVRPSHIDSVQPRGPPVSSVVRIFRRPARTTPDPTRQQRTNAQSATATALPTSH